MSKLWDQFCEELRWNNFLDGWLAVGYAVNGMLITAVRVLRIESARRASLRL